jgi:hypothetical protein
MGEGAGRTPKFFLKIFCGIFLGKTVFVESKTEQEMKPGPAYFVLAAWRSPPVLRAEHVARITEVTVSQGSCW